MECPICIEKITPSRKIECPYCEYTTCKSCSQKYILNSQNDASCMNCHKTFTRDQMMTLFTKNFVIKDYKNHRENVLLERETAMMPATQHLVTRELERRNFQNQIDGLQSERSKLKRKIWEIDTQIRRVYMQQHLASRNQDTEKRQFIHRCSQENCKGFLSSAWKCEICKKYTCSECNAPRGENKNEDGHICNEEQKESFQVIRNECKKCPKCATFIFKISGCDQMWCTGCQTSFSWRTGQEISGQIHNPHYFEFLRRGNPQGHLTRDYADIPCGGRPTHVELSRFVQRLGNTYNKEVKNMLGFHRIVLHIEHVERPRYDTNVTDTVNSDIRIKYMLNEMSENDFKKTVQKREKAIEKKRDINMILTMLIDTMSDFMRAAIIENKIVGPLENCYRVAIYANTEMKKISETYDCVVPIIDFNNTNGIKLVSLKHNMIGIEFCALE